MRSTAEALNSIMCKENINLFKKHKVLSKIELEARNEILLEGYCTGIAIEAKTMLSMAKRQILPVAIAYSGEIASSVQAIAAAGADASVQKKQLDKLCSLAACMQGDIEELETALAKTIKIKSAAKQADACRDTVIPAMDSVRQVADELETIVDADLWPLPTYADMLFVK